MAKRKKFHARPRGQHRRLRIILWAGIPLAALLLIDWQLRPVIQTMISYQARNYAVQAINEAVYRQISNQEIGYDDMIQLKTDAEGKVTALQTDMAAMGQLQTGITREIAKEAARLREEKIRVPLGTLLGGPFFSGRGPEIQILLIPADLVETSVTNVFDSAGINQTRHQITLNVTMHLTAIIPGYSVSADVATNVCLAETVIVGLVPEAYTVVGDGTDPLVGMIEDYQADDYRTAQ